MTVKEYNGAVEAYSDNLYRFVLKNCRNEVLAQDVVQESYTRLWVKINTVSPEKVKSYLFTTAYHAMIDMLKRESRETGLDGKSDPGDEREGQYSDLGEVLDSALSTLPEIQRSVVLLRDYEGYSYQEIGQITDLTESQVKVYIYRARVSLKKFLVRMDQVI